MRPIFVPPRLASTCVRSPDRAAWLRRLPDLIRRLSDRWSLTIGPPFEGDDVTCSWVAPVRGSDGTSLVLKLGMPHMEGEQEIAGLRLLDGNPTVRLLDADETLNAMLLERCEPGTSLRELPETEQDPVVARLLRRVWRAPLVRDAFRPLSAMLNHWASETREAESKWSDTGLVNGGLQLFDELSVTTSSTVLLATDLHAGNILRAQREQWLMIDPKPFVGDPAYDATQHLLNCRERLRTEPERTIARFADLLESDPQRVRLWTFARLAAEPRENWNDDATQLAKTL